MVRIPVGRAYVIAFQIVDELWASGADLVSVTPVGGLRRFEPEVAEISVLAVTPTTDGVGAILDASSRLRSVTHVMARAASSVMLATSRGEVTVYVAERPSAGATLVSLTGSPAHVQKLASRAESRHLRLASGRLTDARDGLVECETEEGVYERLGLPFIAPELRQGEDEIDAAREDRLPHLLADAHVRGDLHMHTTWSDGRDSLEGMVRASRSHGYEYIAITDHSQSSFASRTLAVDQIVQQRAEIDHLRRRYQNIQILHGIELEILRDGQLDFEDSVLEGFDIVLASLHDHGGQPGEVLTSRYLRAIAHPLVNVITHPANRSPAESPGYDLDFERIFSAARETGTALEVDGAPGHLDMDGSLARRAAAAGVTIVVNSDCHRADRLSRQMRFGVATARRGWIEPSSVLNTRSVDEVRAFVARKRASA
jgi:DNA polymerase (family 10)